MKRLFITLVGRRQQAVGRGKNADPTSLGPRFSGLGAFDPGPQTPTSLFWSILFIPVNIFWFFNDNANNSAWSSFRNRSRPLLELNLPPLLWAKHAHFFLDLGRAALAAPHLVVTPAPVPRSRSRTSRNETQTSASHSPRYQYNHNRAIRASFIPAPSDRPGAGRPGNRRAGRASNLQTPQTPPGQVGVRVGDLGLGLHRPDRVGPGIKTQELDHGRGLARVIALARTRNTTRYPDRPLAVLIRHRAGRRVLAQSLPSLVKR